MSSYHDDEEDVMPNEPTTLYPVLFLFLRPIDHGFKQGYRFMIEQPDYDRHWFVTETAARDFIHDHGLSPISDEAMKNIRADRSIPTPRNDVK